MVIDWNNIIKILTLHKAIHRFNPIKSSMLFFTKIEQSYRTICIEPQKAPNIQNKLKKE